MGALIVLDVHGRDVVKNMIKARVDNLNDFGWTCQLRYYWEEDEDGFDAFAK
jgi:dynein heavy chain